MVQVFTESILRNPIMAPAQSGQLIMFMMDRWGQVWEMPEDIEQTVSARLSSLGIGNKEAMPRMGEQKDSRTSL